MDWLERLNRGAGRVPLGRGTVEVLHWAYARHLPDNRPHRHTFFEACLVGEHGRGEFIVQDRRLPLRPGDLFVARPGVVHQIVNTGRPDMELSWVCFQWARAAQKPPCDVDRLLRAFADSDVRVAADEGGRLAALWRAIRAASGGPPSLGDEAQRLALVSALVIGVAQAASGLTGPASEMPAVDGGGSAARLAVRFIHDNLGRPLPLAEIAAQVHVSPRHLARLVTRFTGVTPAQYITHARLDRARALLRHSPLPIKEIAAAVGYPDVHHFTRVFSARYDCPPGEFRRDPERGHVPDIQRPGDLV